MTAFMTALATEGLDTVSRQKPPTPEKERAFIAAAAASNAVILIALEGATIVGLLDAWPGGKPFNKHVCHFGMSVARTHRRQGLGRRLVLAAIEQCRSWQDVCRLELEIVPWNTPAIALYQSLDFVIEGRKSKAINLRGEPEDLIVMALTW